MDDYYKSFLAQMSQIEVMARSIKGASAKEFDQLTTNHSNLIKNGLEKYSQSHHNMFFRALSTGEPMFYDYTSLSIDQLKDSLVKRKNKHYQWLLSEAFELFEDLVEYIYAFIGQREPKTWPAKELCGETESSLSTKPFDWWLQKSEKQAKLSVKLECLRKRFPNLSLIEQKNHYDINFRFAITLIEMLRHIAVHSGGRIKREDDFIRKVFEQAGMANNGKYAPEKLNLIRNFLNKDDHGVHVSLLEVEQHGTPFHIDRLGAVFDWLLAYSDYVYRVLVRPTYVFKLTGGDV
ncbi:hypothetical protein [Rhodoferax sp.]|uniref:hypothetical protein n=1 Tax=Rhodoferax sp. TaxID=50421 RepID=UPI0026369D79|nr:hypothetical protein [Rhodoferax sp.]MDD3938008.1 hypothetical protein [Rhodoferax sp.]